VFALLTLAGSAVAQDAVDKMRSQYAAEGNPVDKAKILAKLGPREMTAVRSLFNSGDADKGLAALKQYRDEIRDTTQALVASGIDATRHPSGFKELQISLRGDLNRLDDLILSLHQDLRPDFRAVRADLEVTQNTLIDTLFPAPKSKRAKNAGER